MRSRTRTVVINAATNYFRYLVGMVVMFLLTPYIIHTVGAEDFGLWSLIFSVIGVLGLLDLGFGTSTVRYVAECRGSGDVERRNRLLSTLLLVYLVLGVLALLVAGGFSLVFNRWLDIPVSQAGKAQAVFLIVSLRLAFGLPLGLFYGVLFGEQKIHLINAVQCCASILYALGAWAVLGHGWGIMGLAWTNFAALIVEHVAYLVFAYRSVGALRVSPARADRRLLREVASFSVFTFVINVAALILLRTDPVIIKLFLPLSAVAVYAVAMKVAEVGLLLTKQFVNVLAPLVAQLKATGEQEKLRFVLVNTTKFTFAPAVMMAAALYVFATEAITMWIGPGYEGAGAVAMVLMTAMAISVPQMTASSLLTMTGRHKYAAWAAAVSVVINIGASLVLVRVAGILGVALGTLIAAFLVDIFMVVRKACREHGIGLPSYTRRALVSAIVPGVAQYLVTYLLKMRFAPPNLLVLVLELVPGAVVYLAVFWLWFVEPSEKLLLREKLLGRRVVSTAGSA